MQLLLIQFLAARVHACCEEKLNLNLTTGACPTQEAALQLRTHRIPLNGLQEALEKLALKDGIAIDSRLYAFALGLTFADGREPLTPPAGGESKADSGGGAAAAAAAKGVGKGLPPRRRGKDAAGTSEPPAAASTDAHSARAKHASSQDSGVAASGGEDGEDDASGALEAERLKDIYTVQEVTSTLQEWAGNWDWTQAAALALASCAALAVGSLIGASARKQ